MLLAIWRIFFIKPVIRFQEPRQSQCSKGVMWQSISDKNYKNKTMKPFRYFDKGSMAVIGRASAVADLNYFRMSGYPAWLAWLFVHIDLSG
jgi:NADH dehydrogenase FAD-containing subunit